VSFTLRRIGGCIQASGLMELLFLDGADVLPVRLVTKCKRKLSEVCAFGVCPRYRAGTAGSHTVAWDRNGARV